MSLIKRIITWLIALFKRIFGVSKKKKVSTNSKEINKSILKKKSIASVYNESLPSYMMIDEQDKLFLIKRINELKDSIILSNKSKQISKIMVLLTKDNDTINKVSDYLNSENYLNLNVKKINALLHEFSNIPSKDIDIIIKDIDNHKNLVKNNIKSLDEIIAYLENNDISIESKSIIDDKIQTLFDNKQKDELTIYDKDIINIINNWDRSIISEIKTEYQIVNYITISTVIVDRILNKYQKLENDYERRLFNQYYYEREINKIKEQIKYLKNLKNTHSVNLEIEKLRKELYTKSKDKYDILYNNEIFINLENRCDKLLNKVKQKVIDLKKVQEKDEIKEENKDKQKKDYLENIIRRFQDLNLSQKLIIEYQNKIIDNKDLLSFLDKTYAEFIKGVNEPFNYERNKAKTELVKLLNDLNSVISLKNKTHAISIDHINFRMSDLIDAVMVKKREVNDMINNHDVLENSELVDAKIDNFKKKFLLKEEQKKLIKKFNNNI